MPDLAAWGEYRTRRLILEAHLPAWPGTKAAGESLASTQPATGFSW